MPGFQVLAVFWPPLAAWREMQICISLAHHCVGDDVPVVGWNDVQREKIDCPRQIAAAPGAFEVNTVAALGVGKNRALPLYSQNRSAILYSHVVRPQPSIRTRHFQSVTHRQHHEIKLGPRSALLISFDLASEDLPAFHFRLTFSGHK